MWAAMWLGALLTLGFFPRRERASYSCPVVSAPGQPTEATVSYVGGDFILGEMGPLGALCGPRLSEPFWLHCREWTCGGPGGGPGGRTGWKPEGDGLRGQQEAKQDRSRGQCSTSA